MAKVTEWEGEKYSTTMGTGRKLGTLNIGHPQALVFMVKGKEPHLDAPSFQKNTPELVLLLGRFKGKELGRI